MIRKSFIMLEGVGKGKEAMIWKQGIHSWEDFLSTESVNGISHKSKLYYDKHIRNAKQALYSFDSAFFNLPSTETWRLYNFFRNDSVFIDIEVSGVSRHDQMTAICLFDGFKSKTMIAGINMNISALRFELSRYKLIVTYNGGSFDIPFINKRYPELLPNIPHIDLRPLCARIGLCGGLKMIEAELGIKRNPIIEKIYNGDPYRLWRIYRATGDDYYLKLFVEYNEDDSVNLQKIADYVINISEKHIIANCFLSDNEIRSPQALYKKSALGSEIRD